MGLKKSLSDRSEMCFDTAGFPLSAIEISGWGVIALQYSAPCSRFEHCSENNMNLTSFCATLKDRSLNTKNQNMYCIYL